MLLLKNSLDCCSKLPSSLRKSRNTFNRLGYCLFVSRALKHKGRGTMDDLLLHTVWIISNCSNILLNWAVNKHRYQNGSGRIQNRIDIIFWPMEMQTKNSIEFASFILLVTLNESSIDNRMLLKLITYKRCYPRIVLLK